MLNLGLTVLLLVSIASCGNDDKRLKEKTRVEGETLTNVENSNLAIKAEAMEKDLVRRHRFYQAVKGTYEGSVSSSEATFKIRITLSPSLSPIAVGRTRQLEEITADLNNLMMNTKASQWDPSSSLSSVSCTVSDIRPDIERGEITIAKEGCQNFYLLKVADAGTNATATSIAEQILNGSLENVKSIEGSIQPATNAEIYRFTAFKVEE